MDKQLSNKITFFIIAALLLISGNYIFNNTLGGTFKLKQEFEEMLMVTESERDYSADLNMVNQRLESMDKLMVGKELSAGQVQQLIMKRIEELRGEFNVQITNVPAPHQYKMSDYTVITGIFEVEGRYADILMLIHEMETSFDKAILASVNFEVKRNFIKNKEQLYATLYFQNIKKND